MARCEDHRPGKRSRSPPSTKPAGNSGVIHSGIYYKPGSLKAVLCRTGREMLYDFAQSEEIPHERCGKIILAVEEEELPRLQNLYARGQENQIPGLQLLNSSDIPAYEPHARGVGAIYVPVTGIIDYGAVTQRLLAPARQRCITASLSSALPKAPTAIWKSTPPLSGFGRGI